MAFVVCTKKINWDVVAGSCKALGVCIQTLRQPRPFFIFTRGVRAPTMDDQKQVHSKPCKDYL